MSTRAAALAAQPDPVVAAAAAVQANAAAAAVAAVAAVPGFALSLARATAGVIDMTDKAGSNLFNKGADSLSIRLANGDRGFDGKVSNLNLFLAFIKQRANVFDWHTILDIPVNGVNRNLLEAYGQISMANVQMHVLTYIDQPMRDAQNSFMVYECLSKSLQVSALNDVLTKIETFTERNLQSGPLFLNTIIKKAAINTRSTTTHVRTSLSSLDRYILTIDCDLHLLHLYVKGLKRDLTARGETSSDILFNLFKGYAAVKDLDFKEYIKAKKSAYEDGTLDLEEETLMDIAQNKFDALVQDGTCWNRPTKEQEQNIALTATIENMAKSNATANKDISKKSKPDKKKSSSNSPRENEGEYAWKSVAPSDKSKVKVVNIKTYHWCPQHKAWTLHTAGECRLDNKLPPTTSTTTTAGNEGGKLSFSQALVDMIDDEASAQNEEEEDF
eukprot:scaffold131938_cov70-Attheya_sp.AAC.2